jgi:myo-inositol-1(or 4)-monophosphatase
VGGELVVGVIYNPMTDELFTAAAASGPSATAAGCRSQLVSPLQAHCLAPAFPMTVPLTLKTTLNHFIRFQKAARGIRRAGAAALDLAYLAAGSLDGFWEVKLKPWDVAAGTLLVREAGWPGDRL